MSTYFRLFNSRTPPLSRKWKLNVFLLGILTDLSSSVRKGAQQLKHAVEEKSLIGSFTKEHEKFLTEKRTSQRREESAVPPWSGYNEEEDMKKQILALSKVYYRSNLFNHTNISF
jgi:hypothetical protein